MPRSLYTGLLILTLPLFVLRLLWRSRGEPAYRAHIGERFGHYRDRFSTASSIWLHAVSVGETNAAAPLIRALLAEHPHTRIVLTHMTPGGRAAAARGYADLINAGRLISVYLPYDYPAAIRRFLRHFTPRLGLLMETEIWPNLIATCHAARVPVALINARLSARSAARGARFGKLFREAANGLTMAVAQTAADAERLAAFGVQGIAIAGNLKFDHQADPALLTVGQAWRRAAGDRPIVLLSSTREGEGVNEEELLLANLPRALADRILLVIVPRHPQRFGAVRRLCAATGRPIGARSDGPPSADLAIWLGDSMGELAAYYTMADCALIGGSLAPLGAHNLIEAAACGCPVLVGPHSFNFAQVTDDAIAAGAALRVSDAIDCWAQIAALLDEPARLSAMRAAALAFAHQHQGATQASLAALAPWLPF